MTRFVARGPIALPADTTPGNAVVQRDGQVVTQRDGQIVVNER